MSDLACVIWDVDGTLVDSEALIQEAMAFAYDRAGLDRPDPHAVRGMVGLSLDRIFPQLLPQLDAREHADLVQGYRDAYFHMRAERGSAMTAPFYPGVRETLEELRGGHSRLGQSLVERVLRVRLPRFNRPDQFADVHACPSHSGARSEVAILRPG